MEEGEFLNAEGAKDSQRTQKKTKRIFMVFFCVLCVTFAPSAFKTLQTHNLQ
jgi:hypothetical protein